MSGGGCRHCGTSWEGVTQRSQSARDCAVTAEVLHVLVNNVGTNTRKATVEYSGSDFDSIMATNLKSAFHVTQLCHGMLRRAQGGCVIFNSSVAGGPTAMKSGSVYAMTKGALCNGDSHNRTSPRRPRSVCTLIPASDTIGQY